MQYPLSLSPITPICSLVQACLLLMSQVQGAAPFKVLQVRPVGDLCVLLQTAARARALWTLGQPKSRTLGRGSYQWAAEVTKGHLWKTCDPAFDRRRHVPLTSCCASVSHPSCATHLTRLYRLPRQFVTHPQLSPGAGGAESCRRGSDAARLYRIVCTASSVPPCLHRPGCCDLYSPFRCWWSWGAQTWL